MGKSWLRRFSNASRHNFVRFQDSEADVGPSDEPPGGSYGPEDTSAVSTPTQSRVDLTNADSFRTVYINDPV
jgi:hypothetical protein